MIKGLLVYLKIHFIASLLFCLIGNIQGVLFGIPLYGVFQSYILILAIKKEIYKIYPWIHKSDLLLASFFMVVFTISIILNILYMFCKNYFPTLEMLNSCTHMLYFGLWGTVIYILVTLPLIIRIFVRKLNDNF